jgi:DNA-binding CsgD family transcriptional regulator/tetratricopeptide (TPR) repeat protein
MELIERAGFLATLQSRFTDISAGEGHCILLSGEAGIGKTSLVRAFCQQRKRDASIYLGTCDALFTPRPLAPLYDIIWQIWGDNWKKEGTAEDRAGLFTQFFHQLATQEGPILIVFEDIHWADEATLDFIKFLARRITRIECLFILTFRDDEVHSLSPLRNLLGQLPPHSFTRMRLTPLSRLAVEGLATEKGYNGEDVFGISGGNPFYVNEILASYSAGIPDNIKDSILSVYNRLDGASKQIWQVLSVLPTGCEIAYMEKLESEYGAAIAGSLEAGLLVLREGRLHFKHELYRRTIETSLSPFIRIALNKKVLETCAAGFEQAGEIERIIHHAKNANAHDMVVQYAPVAAKQAASLGAHVEASKLFFSALEYYQGKDKDKLVELYECYANECFLTNRIKEAIVYQTKALNIWKEQGDPEKLGNSMSILSRFWWFDGNRKQAEAHARQAIEALNTQPPSRAKAMAFSNMSRLKMLSDQAIECMHWGELAITMAKELGDDEILSDALNNVGTVRMRIPLYKQRGIDLLRQSLDIALQNSFQEHAARAYTNLGSDGVKIKDFPLATKVLEEGLRYCEERELGSWLTYMLSWKARLLLDTGKWEEAARIAGDLLATDGLPSIVKAGALVVLGTIKMRRGEADALPILLEARVKASEVLELQRILPALTALLEYEWITAETCLEKGAIEVAISLIGQAYDLRESSEFDFWLSKARGERVPLHALYEGYRADTPEIAIRSAAHWEKLGCPYEQSLFLFEGDEEDKRKAISFVHELGATAVYEKMKLEMRSSGIRSIPRGVRKTTLANPALLTDRELGILELLKEGLQNKEIGSRLFISSKTVDHHISSILFKLEVNSRVKAVQEALRLGIVK